MSDAPARTWKEAEAKQQALKRREFFPEETPSYESSKDSRYPHALIGIPRSLIEWSKWRITPQSGRYYYKHLLTYSNIKTFKTSWLPRERLLIETNLSLRSMLRYEAIFEKIGVLKVIKPYERDLFGNWKRCNQYEFTLARFINDDYKRYNDKAGHEVHPYVTDYRKLYKVLKRGGLEETIDSYFISDKTKLLLTLQDEMSKKIQFLNIDNNLTVHLECHSKNILLSFVHQSFSDYGLRVKVKYSRQKDFTIDPRMTFQSFRKKIARELKSVHRINNIDKLIQRLEF